MGHNEGDSKRQLMSTQNNKPWRSCSSKLAAQKALEQKEEITAKGVDGKQKSKQGWNRGECFMGFLNGGRASLLLVPSLGLFSLFSFVCLFVLPTSVVFDFVLSHYILFY